MRSEIKLWGWILLLVLLLTGAISLGDVFSFFLYIIGLLILVALVGALIFRRRVRKAQREASERGEEFRGYTWHFGGYENTSRPRNPEEGKVRVKTTVRAKKRVSDDVGEYVDFKEH